MLYSYKSLVRAVTLVCGIFVCGGLLEEFREMGQEWFGYWCPVSQGMTCQALASHVFSNFVA